MRHVSLKTCRVTKAFDRFWKMLARWPRTWLKKCSIDWTESEWARQLDIQGLTITRFAVFPCVFSGPWACHALRSTWKTSTSIRWFGSANTRIPISAPARTMLDTAKLSWTLVPAVRRATYSWWIRVERMFSSRRKVFGTDLPCIALFIGIKASRRLAVEMLFSGAATGPRMLSYQGAAAHYRG